MPVINISFNEPAWPELETIAHTDRLIEVHEAISITGLQGGMVSGNTSVAIRIDLPDGRVVIVHTSLTAWMMATAALRGRFGEV